MQVASNEFQFHRVLTKDIEQGGLYITRYTGFVYPKRDDSQGISMGTAEAQATLYLSTNASVGEKVSYKI